VGLHSIALRRTLSPPPGAFGGRSGVVLVGVCGRTLSPPPGAFGGRSGVVLVGVCGCLWPLARRRTPVCGAHARLRG
jgi:hypothetical protein